MIFMDIECQAYQFIQNQQSKNIVENVIMLSPCYWNSILYLHRIIENEYEKNTHVND